jgi:hypothetical protein
MRIPINKNKYTLNWNSFLFFELLFKDFINFNY